MTPDYTEVRKTVQGLARDGAKYFADVEYCSGGITIIGSDDGDYYWAKLEEEDQQTAYHIQSRLIEVARVIANGARQSALLTETDRKDLGGRIKSLRASLRLRRFESWDAEYLNNEDIILGVRQAGQSDDYPVPPDRAGRDYQREISKLFDAIDLIEISPGLSVDGFRINPQATVDYEPDTAFVMMQIDPAKPFLEDVYSAIKDSFAQFGITAVRADEIEHQDVITDKIIERIKTSEFLIADLTGERPSVYYEIGYAHALRRKVIMYRSSGARLHFDLAAYNCPEYANLSDLKSKLVRRLEEITNRPPKDASPSGG